MRDDLHRTVPLARPWGKVLRCLSAERWSAEELAPLIVGTVRRDLRATDPSSNSVISSMLAVEADMFDDGADKLRLTLEQVQKGPLAVAERATCEVALGVLAAHGMTHNFAALVVQASGLAHARDEVEHMLNRVSAVHGSAEAAQARQVLNKALSLCDFTTTVAMPPTRAKKSVHQLLDTDLALGD